MGTAGQPNRRERMELILDRDGAACVWCRRPLEVGLVVATTEHLVPRIKGGPSWIENELAACKRCNGQRGHRTPADWIEECRERGWEPDVDAVVGAFIRIEKPLDFDAVDRQPVDLVFALFAPDGAGVDHLKALALVSRTMRNADIAAKLRANDDPDTLYTILIESQGTRAA